MGEPASIWISAGRRFKFHKRSQLFIRVCNETFSVIAMRVCNKTVRQLESIAETQPQLQPALLRLSAMISQYFTV
jgi:hypothetical protein